MATGFAAALVGATSQEVLDAIDAGAAGGSVYISAYTRPTEPGGAITGNPTFDEAYRLATLTMATPAGTAAPTLLTFSAGAGTDTANIDIDLSVSPCWCRVSDSDGNFVLDTDVTVTGGGGEIEINASSYTIGETVSMVGGAIVFVLPIVVVPSEDLTLKETFSAVITGTADSLADAEIPIATISARIRTGDESYLSVSVPYSSEASDAITDRPNGALVVYRKLGDTETAIAGANTPAISKAEGARSKTITLTGYQTVTATDQKAVELIGLQYAGTNDGTRRFRCSLNSSIVPGDIARMVERSDEDLTVDLISITVSKSSSLMEISEA